MDKPVPDLDSKGRDRNKYARCKMCNVSALDTDLSLEPTRSVLLFGVFPNMRVPMEYRCQKCEDKVYEGVRKSLDGLLGYR